MLSIFDKAALAAAFLEFFLLEPRLIITKLNDKMYTLNRIIV